MTVWKLVGDMGELNLKGVEGQAEASTENKIASNQPESNNGTTSSSPRAIMGPPHCASDFVLVARRETCCPLPEWEPKLRPNTSSLSPRLRPE